MPIDDYLNQTPPPPMGPADLGLPVLPPPPQVPQPPQRGGGIMQTIMQAVPGILGGAMGPGAGTGLLQGAVMGQQRNDQQARLDHQQAMQAYAYQQSAYNQQAQEYDAAFRQRQQILQQNVTALRSVVKEIPDKKAYDEYVSKYAQAVQQAYGFRMPPDWWINAAPFAAPDAPKAALEIYERWLKDPINKKRLDDDPQGALNDKLPVPGWLGKGEPTPHRTVAQIRAMAGIAGDGPDGPIVAPKGRSLTEFSGEMKNYLAGFIAEDKAHGIEQTDARFAENVKRAQEQVAKAAPKGPEHPAGTLPPRTQTRVDAKTRGFDSLPIVKTTQKMAEAVSFAQGLDPHTQNPADDQALIYAFAKAMDPDSVVREGEYATVQKYAQSWAQTIGFNASRVFSNTAFLTPQARANMKKTILAKYAAGKSQYDNVRKEYARQIDKITGEPGSGESWLTDYAAAFPEQAPTKGGGPTVGERRKFGEQLGEWDGQGWKLVP
jgi:hypothetical protein